MTEILLVRHGQTDWNLEHRVQGHTDTPLNAAGIEQARALAESLAAVPLVAVYSRDLARARDTAAEVARVHGLEVALDRDLREKNFGSWEGMTDAEIAVRFPHAVRGRWGDGEATEEVAERAVAAMGRIRALHPAGPVLVVAHGGPLRAILDHLAVEHGRIGNCEVFRVRY